LTAVAICFLYSKTSVSKATTLEVTFSMASKLVFMARNLTSLVAIDG
jgi:hypothetical protein